MFHRVDGIVELALQTRADFEHGIVTDDEIIEAALAYNTVHWLATYSRENPESLRTVGFTNIRVPISEPEIFPAGHCNVAALVLKQRLEQTDLLGDNTALLVEGGCGEDKAATDPTSFYHNYHAFLGIGETALGTGTIADITADQFEGLRLPPVYVGPLRSPWTDNPRLEQQMEV